MNDMCSVEKCTDKWAVMYRWGIGVVVSLIKELHIGRFKRRIGFVCLQKLGLINILWIYSEGAGVGIRYSRGDALYALDSKTTERPD